MTSPAIIEAARPLPFSEIPLKPELHQAIADAGYALCTPIQQEVIPTALRGIDVTGTAQTGTGKTAAFLVPIIEKLVPTGQVQALIVTPTRELAIQVCGEAEKLCRHTPTRVTAIYGGTSIGHQRKEIFSGVDIVVGTPGRLIDFHKSAILRLRFLKWLVLDEADRMLDMGFIDDVDYLCRKSPMSRQTMLFSATMPPEILRIARSYMHTPHEVSVSRSTMVAEGVHQSIYRVEEHDKMRLLLTILREEKPERCLVFTARREATGEVMRKLRERGFEAARLSSLQEQRHREGIMDMFRRGEVQILVATDVAGRGIDIGEITHVINYDIPMEADDFVHRVGRTARAGRRGHAITFVTSDDTRRLAKIRALTGLALPLVRYGQEGEPIVEDAEGDSSEDRRRRGSREGQRGSSGGHRSGGGRPASGGGHTTRVSRGEGRSRPHAQTGHHAPKGTATQPTSQAAVHPASGTATQTAVQTAGDPSRRRRRGGRGRGRSGGSGGSGSGTPPIGS